MAADWNELAHELLWEPLGTTPRVGDLCDIVTGFEGLRANRDYKTAVPGLPWTVTQVDVATKPTLTQNGTGKVCFPCQDYFDVHGYGFTCAREWIRIRRRHAPTQEAAQ